MKGLIWLALVLVAFPSANGRAQRINHEGRILGAVPIVTNAVLFNTPEADGILSSMQIMPVTSAWNEDISRRPLLANSDAMMAQISADLQASRRTLRAFQEMNFVLVPDSQPLVPVSFLDYPEESYPSPYPAPPNMPIETWPSQTGGLTLEQWQADVEGTGGDRHAIIVQPGAGFIWEMWQAKKVGSSWQASNGAKFDLKSNTLRPAGWTSADAAGLPMFPALPRYDECQRGVVEHALRIVVARTRRAYIYPATHYASTTAATQTNVPAMGQRLRLKSSYVIPSTWTREEKAILGALKKYGAMVADNGGFFSISVTPDNRWGNALNHLSSVGITNFEVIQTTGPNEGPRSAGAPSVSAGADRSVPEGAQATLDGTVSFQGSASLVGWRLYSGPGIVTFGNAQEARTTASFSAPGTYTLMLSANDGLHAVAYDAVEIKVEAGIQLSARRSGTNLVLVWIGGLAPYTVESKEITGTAWTTLITTNSQAAEISISETSRVFRVRSQ